jgi:ketol-acid reductoisomerase
VRKDGASWKEAQQDGWIPGKNLFDIPEAIKRGSIIMNLLSDAAQSETWPTIKPLLTKGKVRDSFNTDNLTPQSPDMYINSYRY